jgi:cytochrome P450
LVVFQTIWQSVQMIRDPLRCLEERFDPDKSSVKLGLFPYKVLLGCSPDFAKSVLLEQAKYYSKQTPGFRRLKSYLGENLLTMDGSVWQENRKSFQSTFAQIDKDLKNEGKEALKKWARNAVESARKPMSVSLSHWAMEQVIESLFRLLAPDKFRNAKPGSVQIDFDQLACDVEFISKDSVFSLKSLLTPDRIRKRRQVKKRLKNSLKKYSMSEQDLALVVIGAETSALSLTWAIELLARFPEMQDRIRKELNERNADIHTERVEKAECLENFYLEVLRMFPPGWNLGRRAIKDHEILGSQIKKGTIVFISPWLLHRHPNFWEDPDQFNPDRFKDRTKINRFAFIPFGAGPRACIAQSLGMVQSLVLLGELILKFRIDLKEEVLKGQIPTACAYLTTHPKFDQQIILNPI